eukprot:scaffold67160_cov28-Tisochrysis_lutea.AAC.13
MSSLQSIIRSVDPDPLAVRYECVFSISSPVQSTHHAPRDLAMDREARALSSCQWGEDGMQRGGGRVG